MNETAVLLFDCLRDILYNPSKASLELDRLDGDFVELGKGLLYLAECLDKYYTFAKALAKGDLNLPANLPRNELLAPMKALQSSLRHLTWQSQQVANGDYKQRVEFMGEFSTAFNTMIEQLAERQRKLEDEIEEKDKKAIVLEGHAYFDSMTRLYNRFYGMHMLDTWKEENRRFALIFADMDNLKHINDAYGHREGDKYIINFAGHLKNFSIDTVVCRLGGDEFMLLVPGVGYDEAYCRMEEVCRVIAADEYVADKEYFYNVSFGVAHSDEEASASKLLSLADERMYENKRANKKTRAARETGAAYGA